MPTWCSIMLDGYDIQRRGIMLTWCSIMLDGYAIRRRSIMLTWWDIIPTCYKPLAFFFQCLLIRDCELILTPVGSNFP